MDYGEDTGTLERSVIKLAPAFYDGVFTSKNWAGDVGAHQGVTPNEFCIQLTRATASRNANIGTGSG